MKTIQFNLLDGQLPGRVQMVLSDNPDLEQAGTVFSFRMESQSPYNRSVVLAQIETLRLARDLIDEEIERLSGLRQSTY